jgi:outer membrane receptor protein involved in Fe transport
MPCTARGACALLVMFAVSLSAAAEAPPDAAEPPPSPEPGEVQPDADLSRLVIPVDEISKTAARAERNVLDVPGNVTRIDRSQIERSGARDLPDLLRREAGVFVTNTTTNPEGYTVEFRGFNNGGGNGSSTLVLVDGRRVNEPSSSAVDWALIPLGLIESIEIVRGPASALYGENALAGVIGIRTLRPERGLQATLIGRAGTYDTGGGGLWVGGGAGPVRASGSFEGRVTDSYRDRADFRDQQGQMDLSFDLGGRGTLGLRGGYGSQHRDRPGSLTQDELTVDRRQAAVGSDEDFDRVRERFGQAWLDLSLAEPLALHVESWHRTRTDGAQTSDPFFRFTTDGQSDVDGVSGWFELDVAPLGHRLRTVTGCDWLQEDYDFDSAFEFFPFEASLSATRARRQLYGLFLQTELNLTEDLILSAGVRRDAARYRGADALLGRDLGARFVEWSPKAALTWRVVEPLSVYVSYARGFRFPNFDEAFGFFGFSPGLLPQTSNSYEVGAKLRTQRITANLAAYTMSVEDEIFFDPLAPNAFSPFLTGVNVNLDRVRHRGVEASASIRPVAWLELYGSYTFDDVTIRRDLLTGLAGFRLPLTPRHRGTAGAILYLPWGFEVGANANYVGSRPLANDVRNQLERLPSYASYDARVGWRREIATGLSLLVDATAYNVTNRKYSEFGGISAFSPRVGFYPAPERHYLIGARLELRR